MSKFILLNVTDDAYCEQAASTSAIELCTAWELNRIYAAHDQKAKDGHNKRREASGPKIIVTTPLELCEMWDLLDKRFQRKPPLAPCRRAGSGPTR
mmetsp:Transcript_148191/g.474335  ORF Transcript_148191/g.474335 Transcript_148191/m.474335 type:complete len:96 (+) Transcript_148191:151-438(+)